MEILGHNLVQRQLTNMVKSDRMHHCLLFEGPEGLGKSLVAKWLTGILMCETPILGDIAQSCGQCFACRAIVRDEHSNVIWLEKDPSKKKPQISVGQARDLIQKTGLMPRFGKGRVVIIPEANLLTEDASNALLKTFEEPPTPTTFILVVSSANFLLPTVRSRSQRIRFAPVSTQELSDWFVGQGIQCPSHILAMSQGCPGRALSLLQGEDELWRESMQYIRTMLKQPLTEMYDFTKAMFNITSNNASRLKLQKFERLIACVEMLLRDVVVWQSTQDSADLIWASELDVIQHWADKMDDRCIASIHHELEQLREDSIINVNMRLRVDTLMVLLKRAAHLGYV